MISTFGVAFLIHSMIYLCINTLFYVTVFRRKIYMSNELENCVVKWCNAEKGYGFIQLEEGNDVFVHCSAIQEKGFKSLGERHNVRFESDVGDRVPHAAHGVNESKMT